MEDFAAELAANGIDVVQQLNAQWYNEYVAAEGLQQLSPLPTYGRTTTTTLLLGNSRALWPVFLGWLSSQPEPENLKDPLDTFLKSSIVDVVARFCGTTAYDIHWPWESGERLVSMQRVATACGMCYHDGETQLSIHPRFGAWLAFRAVVVLDAPGLDCPPPERLGCLLSEREKAAAREAMAAALRASDEVNLCSQLHGVKGMERDVRLAWAALRDCVELGRDERYSDAQLTYHYTKEQAVLLQAMREHRARYAVATSLFASKASEPASERGEGLLFKSSKRADT